MDLRRKVGKKAHNASYDTDRRAAAANRQANSYYGAGSEMAQNTNAQNSLNRNSSAQSDAYLREMRARYNGQKGRSDHMYGR